MAVETFFLMGFRAMSDMIKEIFPPGEDNILIKALNKIEASKDENDLIKLIENLLRKIKDIAFSIKDLRFHIIKQLEPAFNSEIILNLEPKLPIKVSFKQNNDVFILSKASPKEFKELPAIFYPYELFKKFLIEDLDVLKIITEGKVRFDKFLELDDIIARPLLGFTGAFFIREDFRTLVKKELPKIIN
ncbi:MAG TPA: hypothetical protein ENI51_11455 [Candidatus Atribacteria bacterium]|nr:hypothetical protein [Candidatus Atribacteria bacterium]